MFCPNCGKNVEDGSRFCGECGAVMEPAQPEAPVGQETLIVPELPVTELPNDAAMNQATIVVPELTDATTVAPVGEEKKKNKTGLLIGLIAGGAVLLIALTVLICWLVFGGSNDSNSDHADTTTTTTTTVEQAPIPDDAPTAEERRSQLKSYTLSGLTFYLSEDFEETMRAEEIVTFDAPELSSVLTAWIYCGTVEEFEQDAGELPTDSASFAKWLSQQEPDGDYEIALGERYGVHYVTQTDGSKMVVIGCYMKDGYYWVVEIESHPAIEATIDYATLAQIDPSFQPPKQDEVTEQEVSVNGLHLRLDSSFTVGELDGQSASYINDHMSLYVRQCLMSELGGVTTSEEFAKAYLEQRSPEDYEALELGNVGDFYYVLMTDYEGWTTLTGLYVYEGWGWQVIGDTRDFENQGQALIDFMSSGWVVKEELPALEVKPQNVEFNGLTAELPGSYKEIYRDDEYVFMSGEMEVYIFTGKVSALDRVYTSAKEMAQDEQEMYKAYWDNADYYELGGVSCLLLWDSTEENSTKTAYGYYMTGNVWWLIEVKNNSKVDNNVMLSIASSGTYEEEEPPTTNKELAIRQRPDMSCDTFADYYGLKVFYDPSWTVDTTWGPTGDYEGDGIAMYSYAFTLADKNVADAVEFAWQLAEEYSPQWQYCEVGLADGVPYVILADDEVEYAMVIGTYSDGTNCWEIDIHCYDGDKLDQAIWFATAGVVEGGANET
ncbi:MAG: zinc ribbon domain-containing protein [Oscillospiraceae bacterium]|nr:zinc ribbon domain-containing protein [Oscillospiraceae bacterium]